MAKWGFTHIVVSIPRLLAGGVLAGAALGYTQLIAPAHAAQPIPSQPTAVKTVVTPYTAAPQSNTQTPPSQAPETETVTPKPTVTAPATHTTAPTPVVTPSSGANVTSLVSAGTTPATSSACASGYTSSNWSGYFALTTGVMYTSVSGSWRVPSASDGNGTTSSDASWIGIGGITSTDLIQIGTENTFTSRGQQQASAFYELLPLDSQPIHILSVSPGDAMAASVSEVSTGKWKLSITDTTTGKSYAKTIAYTSSSSSAEWIEEDPSTTSNQLMPLDNFNPESFTNASATTATGGITPETGCAMPITMISATTGKSVAVPSALNDSGNGFTVTRQ